MIQFRHYIAFTALLSAPLAGNVFAGQPDDFCSSYGCSFDNQTDNVLDFTAHSIFIDNHYWIENYSDSNKRFLVNNLNIKDTNINVEWYDDESDYNELIYVYSDSYGNPGTGGITLDSWDVNITQKINTLFSLESNLNNTSAQKSELISLVNANINVDAHSVFVLRPYSQEDVTVDNIDLYSIVDSTIINNKQHISDNDGTIEQEYLTTRLGSIFTIRSHNDWLDYNQHDLTANLNIVGSTLKAETLAGIELGESSGWVDRNNAFAINLTNSNGQFKNLLTHVGEYLTEGYLDQDEFQVNLDNSVVSAGIYSERHGGLRLTNSSLSLNNGSTFNYLGDCTDTCNRYAMEENENEVIKTPHYDDSYIHQININGGSTFAFSPVGAFKHLYVDEMNSDGTAAIAMNSDVSTLSGDLLDIKQATGKFNVAIQDSGNEPTSQDSLALIYVAKGESGQFLLNDGNGVDIGAYVYDLKSAQSGDRYTWFLGKQSAAVVDPDPTPTPEPTPDPEPGETPDPVPTPDPEPTPEPGTDRPKTSPSTDGVLSMASATQFIFNEELDNLRLRRGDITRNNREGANAWGRVLNSSLRVNGPENSAYKLYRSGMELGGDKAFDIGNDKLMIGLSASMSDNRVKHARGGNSDINAYTAGIYATYVTENNFYIDGLVKYSHFDNELRVKTTNGSQANADYKQNGLGAALEMGYKHQFANSPYGLFAEPYGRMSYLTIEGKSFRFNNGMKAKVDDQKSLLGEIGVSFGAEFALNDKVILSPYIKVAAEHEFISDNDVYINDIHKFTNDYSGTAGKYGVGVNLAVNNHTSVYAEVDYVKGRDIESPMKANIGFRINF
ncbi:autotransporter outer membrane beta-barrel domain-containing protein [Limnobaculum sp. M2-1]|nr:autotransporter outer membrane beta-barrel domain-containing protein [Limnobaculum sp. M2-1]